MKLAATYVQLAAPVQRTPPEILERYRKNRHWRNVPKEWIYRNIDFKDKDVRIRVVQGLRRQ